MYGCVRKWPWVCSNPYSVCSFSSLLYLLNDSAQSMQSNLTRHFVHISNICGSDAWPPEICQFCTWLYWHFLPETCLHCCLPVHCKLLKHIRWKNIRNTHCWVIFHGHAQIRFKFKFSNLLYIFNFFKYTISKIKTTNASFAILTVLTLHV